MPADFWLAMVAQLLVIVGAALRLEHRITALETDVRWLIDPQRTQPGVHREPRIRS